MGLLPDEWVVNPTTFFSRLKYIFGGSEVKGTNSYLPQWFLIRNRYNRYKDYAYVRFVNLNPFISKITIKNGDKTLKKSLPYPASTGIIKLKPGAHNLTFQYGDIKIGQKALRAKAAHIYTFFMGKEIKPSNVRNETADEFLELELLIHPLQEISLTKNRAGIQDKQKFPL